LSETVARLPLALRPAWSQDETREACAHAAVDAFRILGPEAYPAKFELVRLINASTNEDTIHRLKFALAYLGAEGLPPLTALATNRQRSDRFKALAAIRGMGTNARPALPVLIQCLNDEDYYVAKYTAVTLGYLQLEPALVVPALTNALRDSFLRDPWLRPRARFIDSLAQFGPAATSAVPILLGVLEDPNETVRVAATNALRTIDPQAWPTPGSRPGQPRPGRAGQAVRPR
jgi:hypothetical protein